MAEAEQEPTHLTETVLRGAGLAGIGHILTQVLTLGFFVALARLATPADFGVYAAGTLLVGIGMLFSESGMLSALIHRKDRIDEAASTAVISTALAGIVLALVSLASAPLLALLFDNDEVGEVAAATSGLLLLRSLKVVPEALLQRRFSFFRRLVIEPVGVLVFGTTAVIATANGMGVWGLVVGYYASELADVVLSWSLLKWRPRLRSASVAMWRELIAYGRHILATIALHRIEQQVPIVLLGRFAGVVPLGQFGYAARMESTAGSVVVQAGAYVLFPALARITSDRERFREACLRALRAMAAIGFPLGLSLVPLGVPAAVIAFGEVWRDAGYAAMALAPMASAGLLVSFASETLKADGRPDILARIRAVILLASVVFMGALLPFDLIGVAIGLALGTVVGSVYAMVRTGEQLEIPLKDIARQVLPPALAAIVMAAVVTPVEFLLIDASAHGTLRGIGLLVVETLLAIATYLAALRLLGPEAFQELVALIKRLARRGRAAERDEGAGDEPSPDKQPLPETPAP